MRTKKRILLQIVFTFVTLGCIPMLVAQTTIWSEDFTYPDGTVSGSDGKWSIDISDCSFDGDDHFEVRNNRMEGNDLDGEAIWASEVIDISAYSDVSISIDIREVGTMEVSDYINLYYKLDGGPQTVFSTHGSNHGNFGSATAEQTGLNGSTLVIIIIVSNSAQSENHRFDDILVRGDEPGNPGDPSNSGIDPVYVPGNPDCGDMDQLCECTSSFKPSGNGIGTFTYPDGVSEVTATASSGTHFYWTSDLAVCCVIVKGGNNANVYQYDPPSYGDGNLHPPINPNNNQPYGINHIEYCYTADSQQKASISDYVWEDLNGNGIQDDGQTGVANVTVELYICGSTSPVSTTTTDGNGWYEFADLTPGNYKLKFVLPTGYVFTGQNQGGDDTIDSDVNSSGETECITLTAGLNDVTLDAGLYRTGTIIFKKETVPDGSSQSFQFDGGNLSSFSLSDNGTQTFSDLSPGTYTVTENVPVGWELTSIEFDPANSGSSNQETATIELQSNQTVTVTFKNSLQQSGTFIEAEKTANAEFQRTWDWDISKIAYPEEWHLFRGDQGQTNYTVTVTKTGFRDVITVSGEVCVNNTGNLPTENLTIFDHVQYKTGAMSDWADVPNASLTLTPDQLPGTEGECYNYSFTFDAIDGAEYRNMVLVTITNHIGYPGVAYGPEIVKDFELPAQPTGEINGSIHVEDTNGQSWETSETNSWTYSKTYGCDRDDESHENTATIIETQQSSITNVTVHCHALEIEKTVETSFDRNYTWSIDKTADTEEAELSVCKELEVNYKVVVDTEFQDKNYQVTGMITVTNPAPMDALINSLEDMIPGVDPLDVDCSVQFPYILTANSSMQCSYSGDLPDASQRLNTAKVALQIYHYAAAPGQPMSKTEIGETEFVATADVIFSSDPTNIINESVEVNDTNLDPTLLGTVAADDAPKEFTYSKIIGPYDTAGDYLIENLASFITNDTQTTGEDSWAVAVNVPCEEPYAEFEGAPLEGFSCLTVEFHSETSCDVVEWFWDFGDGGTSTEEHPVHTYCPPVDPKFHVSLTVTNTCGKTTTVLKRNYITVYIHVTADFDAEPTVGYGPLSVQFQNKSTGMIDDYLWDFGDGTTSIEHSPVHCYSEPGIYTVTLTASGPLESETKEITQLIQVYDDVAAAGKLSLVLIEGSDCWNEYEDWNNAIDGDTYGWTGTTNAGESDPWAIFMAADGFVHNINKVRMMTDTRVPGKQNDWVTRFEVLVSTTGTAAGDFTSVGEFNNTSGGWNEFTFDPVAAKYVKLNVMEPSNKWRQIGEFEIYEHIELPDIAGSVMTATTPQIASGLDTCTVTVKLADENGNAVSGIEPSAFRIVAEGCGNTCGPVAETVPGTYVGSFTSVVPGDKKVVVWVYDHKVEYSDIASETPVIVSFLEPTYELAALQLVEGTDCYDSEGWENAYDGDFEGADAMVSAGTKWGDSHAIFEFTDQTTKTIHKYRMITDVGIGWEAHWLTHYQLWVSTTGTADDDLVMIHDRNRTSGDWEEFVIEPVDVKYLKLVLLQPAGNWKQIGELEMFTVPVAISRNKTAHTLTAKSLVNLPGQYALQQNYPNPFNPETTIEYHLPQASDVKISIYNIRGQLVQMLENGHKEAGVHHAIWNSVDAAGTDVVSGIYFYRMQATGEDGTSYSFTRRMVLLK